MPATRRGVLLGVLAVATAGAGCNEGTTGDDHRSVTPAPVPRTDEEVLEEAASIERPSVPPVVELTDDHLEAAVGQVEDAIETVEASVESGDVFGVDGDGGRTTRIDVEYAESAIADAERELETARERAPSPAALQPFRRAIRRVAPPLGVARYETGEVELDALEEAVRQQREASAALRDRLDYRLAEPVDDLPTWEAAEAALADAGDLDRAAAALEGADPDDVGYLSDVADATETIELHRRGVDDAERLLARARDASAPSLVDAIETALEGVVDDLAADADRFGPDGESRPNDDTLSGTIARDRFAVGGRLDQRSETVEAWRDDGRLLQALLGGLQWHLAFEAIDRATERTVARVDGEEFPVEEVVDEKRRAVDRIESLRESSALARHLGADSASVLESGDRNPQRSVADAEAGAQTFLTYGVAAEWAELAAVRSDELSRALEAQQS